jgi:hypothetical protein
MLPSGKHTKNYGKSPFLMGKPTISMAMFNSFLYVYQRISESFNPIFSRYINSTKSGWWCGTCLLFFHIFGINLPTD